MTGALRGRQARQASRAAVRARGCATEAHAVQGKVRTAADLLEIDGDRSRGQRVDRRTIERDGCDRRGVVRPRTERRARQTGHRLTPGWPVAGWQNEYQLLVGVRLRFAGARTTTVVGDDRALHVNEPCAVTQEGGVAVIDV